MGRKGFYLIIVSAAVFLVLLFPIRSAAASAEGGTYLTVRTQQLGKIKIYVSPTYKDYFGLVNGLPAYMNTGSTTGYTLNSNGTLAYRITIGQFGESWSYRTASGTVSYTLTVQEYFPDESNIFVAGTDISESQWLLYSIIFIGGAIIIVLWFKR